jgi:Cof subfamily protein (haloacid dehalogenase superfamily)
MSRATNDIALVISDIDGTIITSNHEVTRATREAAEKLRRAGIALSLSSSRPPRSIAPIAGALGLDGPLAAFNGSCIFQLDGRLLSKGTIPPQTIARIKAIADQLAISLWIYDEQNWWAPHRDAFVEREEHTSGFSPNFSQYRERLSQDACKLTVVGNPDLVAQAEHLMLGELSEEVSASRSKPRFLDVTPRGVHKGSVVARLAQLLGITADRVAAIGDGPNDLDMFAQAGLSIAMGQAADQVRAAANYVTTSNDEDGWARAIEKYVLRERPDDN